jgi:hypothetical protein
MREFHSADLLAHQPRPIEWLVDGLLPVGTLGDVSGPPGDGKSTILLSLADHVSRGERWFGRATRQTPVAWITGEASGEDAIQRDLHRLNVSQESDILFLLPESEMFRFDKVSGAWVTTAEGAAILQRCRDSQIGFVVIDTIGSVCAGLVEIDNDQQRQLARHIRREMAGMTFLGVSHTNQASTRDALDWRLHYLSRAGGNGFPGAIRWAAGVSALRPDDAEALGGRVTRDDIAGARLVALGISKHNEMPRPSWNNNSPAVFEIKPDGQLVMVANGEAVALYQKQARAAADVLRKAKAKVSALEGADDDF